LAKQGKKIKEMNRAAGSSHSLALKAKVDQEKEEYEDIEEEEEMTSTSDMSTDLAFFAKKWKGSSFGKMGKAFSKEKKRACYNCDEADHFADKCPYEKRVDKPKFVKGDKPRLKPNPINERFKKNKREGRAFLGTEYTSDEESEDEETVAGVAGLAFSKPGSLFKYDYTKDYALGASTPKVVGSSFMARGTNDHSEDSSSSKEVGSCLMAKGTKVIHSSPSLSSILDDSETENDELDEESVIKGLYKVRCTLRGDALAKFDFLMEGIAERNETIKEYESHFEDEGRRYNLLKQELKNEKCISQDLKQQLEICEFDRTKDLETLDRASLMAQELDASKKELEVAHASLTKDLENLEKANKLAQDELKKLRENHDLLQVNYEKALGSLSDPIVVDDIACASNSTLDQASLIEENKKLKEQLEKSSLTAPKEGNVLDKVLAHHNVRNYKKGVGYNPRNDKNGATPSKKINFVPQGHKVDGKAKENVVNGGATRGNPNHKFAGKDNPSYVLCKGTQGNVYAKYVGPRNGFIWYSIWVPKDLVSLAKEPIYRWVPKSST